MGEEGRREGGMGGEGGEGRWGGVGQEGGRLNMKCN